MDFELHEKIRKFFPVKEGEAVYIQVLCVNPLDLQVEYFDPANPRNYGPKWAQEKKTYFIIDRTLPEPIFFYGDRFVFFKKNLLTDKILRYQLRDQEDLDMNKVRAELKQLATLLKSQAS